MSILSILILIADVWALYELLRSSANLVTKALWAVLIILLPVIGVILWYLLGPKSDSTLASA